MEGTTTRVVALVDGEHYPAVTRWGLQAAREAGYEVVAALLAGGAEKLSADRSLDLGDMPLVRGERDPMGVLSAAIREFRPEAVLDLSDDPVVSYERRMELAGVTLAAGLAYVGPDFRFDPPFVEAPLPVATLAVIGTGKRVAKTGVAGQLARVTMVAGGSPVVVAMGRGGPAEPEVAGPGDVTLEALLARAERGEHAASDFLEDALTAGVPTVGARRAGGGFGGRPFVTNVAQAAARAVALGGDPVILEGSGASLPTVPWDAGVLVVPAGLPPHHLAGYMGPLRLLLSDLVVLIMDTGPNGPENLSALDSHIRRLRADVRVAVAELHPVPLGNVRGKDAFFATTAKPELALRLAREIEGAGGCRVLSVSSRLADRAGLEEDLEGSPPFEVLLTELKAAAVDVAARRAVDRGADVVFVDNRPGSVGGDGELDELLAEMVELSRERAADRGAADPGR
jgi:cyclic 2,3-diphosphoglycerate synthetase